MNEQQPQEEGAPRAAWIEYATGARLDLDLERVGPGAWRAHPPVPVLVGTGDHLRLDRLGPGMTVEFPDVVRRDGPPGEPPPTEA